MRHGSHLNPPNRFERLRRETDLAHLAWDDPPPDAAPARPVEILVDDSRSIVSENDSPDLPFRWSVNPYRGCAHGCSYCYARNTHEYLGMNAGLEFETRLVVKPNAADLLREFLGRPTWNAEPLMFSGVTDCYQPIEREHRLTRACLEVCLEAGQPVSIITKNALVVRDLDVLTSLAAKNLIHVFLSCSSLDAELIRDLEPRASTPAARMKAIGILAGAGVPTGVMVAPIILGINDSAIPGVLEEAKRVGAGAAGWILLRLPLTVEPVFREWLERTRPNEAGKVVGRIRQMRDGKLNASEFGVRMRGKGELAEQLGLMFGTFAKRLGLERRLPPLSRTHFTPPLPRTGQLRLF